MTLSPLRQFVLSAVLWLPAAFLLWFLLSAGVIWPVTKLADWVLPTLLPNAIAGAELIGSVIEIETRLLTPAGAGGQIGTMILEVRPLIYAWCLPLFIGLVMATPLQARQRALQFLIGLPLLWLVVGWGACFDVLKLLAFDAGPLGLAALQHGGWTADAVALGYQFGYLILPAVTPIVLWVLLNRAFLEQIVGWAELSGVGEPNRDSTGHSQPTDGTVAADPSTAAQPSDSREMP